jgi:sporulation protein YlmC with PRC-barrel domain
MAQSTTGGTTTAPRDGTPGNPPSTATQRAADSVTGNRTPADGTPGNPQGTAAGRAVDRTLGTNTTGTNPAGTSAATGTTAAGAGAAAMGAGAGAGAMAVDSAALRNGRRASKIIGSNIYNESNESIGEVDDVIIPPGGGSPVAVISVGGFLGIGSKLVAVPYDRLQMNAERNRWTLSGATKDSLTQLPTFSYDTATNERRG